MRGSVSPFRFALCARAHNWKALIIISLIKVNGKTSDFNPGMIVNTLFPRKRS
jgi:hypothetical protein